MSLFANFYIISALLIICIAVCFFLPELLYRASGRERSWHPILACLLLICSVLLLSGLHGKAIDMAIPNVAVTVKPTPAPEPEPQSEQTTQDEEPQVDFAVSTRLGTIPITVGFETPLELSVANNGAQAAFDCELVVLDGGGHNLAPQKAYALAPQVVSTTLAPGDTGICTWRFTPKQAGEYVLQAAAAAHEQSVSQQVRIKAEKKFTVDVDDAVWVFHSRTPGSDLSLANKLKNAGFHNALAKGEWKTTSEEQYIFYRDKDKTNLDELFVEIGMPSVQPYYYDSERVGSKVKEFFEQNPDMAFLVIIH